MIQLLGQVFLLESKATVNWTAWIPPLATVAAALLAAIVAGSIQEYLREKEYLNSLRAAYGVYLSNILRCATLGQSAAHSWSNKKEAEDSYVTNTNNQDANLKWLAQEYIKRSVDDYTSKYDKYISCCTECGNDHTVLELLERDGERRRRLEYVNDFFQKATFQGKSSEELTEFSKQLDGVLDLFVVFLRDDLQKEQEVCGSLWRFILPKRLRKHWRSNSGA